MRCTMCNKKINKKEPFKKDVMLFLDRFTGADAECIPLLANLCAECAKKYAPDVKVSHVTLRGRK